MQIACDPVAGRRSSAIVHPQDFANWDELVGALPGCGVFHTQAWGRVLEDTYGFKPKYFVVGDASGLDAVLPVVEINSFLTGKRGVSLPFSDYCNPLAVAPELVDTVYDAALEYGRSNGWDTFEVRGPINHPEVTPSETFYRHWLALDPDTDKLFAGLRENTRRNIRKAAKEPIELKIETSESAMRAYYTLQVATRRRHQLPPQPFRFFFNLWKQVIAPGNGFIVLAHHDGELAAGAVYLHFQGAAMYKYGGSHYRFQNSRVNNLVMWEAIRYAAEQRMQTLCLGRSDVDQEGLRRFKKSWNTTEESLSYFKYDFRRDAYAEPKEHSNGKIRALFKYVPSPVSRAIGTALYKHIG